MPSTKRTTGSAFFRRRNDAESEDQRDHDDLKHRSIGHGLEEVGREDVHDGIDERGGFRHLVGKLGRRERIAAADMEHIGEQQADNDGKCRGDHIEQDGLSADGADFFNILQRDDARHNRENDQGHDDHLDQIEENGADRLDVRIRAIRVGLACQADQHAEGQRHQNPCRKRQTFIPWLMRRGDGLCPISRMRRRISHDS